MKKKLISCLIFLIVLFSFLPYSAGAQSDDNFLQNTSSGNVFGAGDNLQINQDIPGDIVLAGGRLEINGNVVDDFIGAGGELIVNGNISGSIIAAGGNITVNGNVGEDVAAAGGHVFLSRNSVVNGDILIGAGDVTLNGVVNGNGDVSAATLKTGDNFKLKGNFKVDADNYPSNLKEDVGGNVSIAARDESQEQYATAYAGINVFGFIIRLLSALALGFVLIYLYPDFVSRLVEIVKDSVLKTGILGLLVLIFLPILAIILLITVFGWSISALMILILAIGILLATIPVKLLAGKIIYNKLMKKEAGKIAYYLIGAVLFALAYEIPYVGGIISFIALIIGLGAIIVWLGERARHGV